MDAWYFYNVLLANNLMMASINLKLVIANVFYDKKHCLSFKSKAQLLSTDMVIVYCSDILVIMQEADLFAVLLLTKHHKQSIKQPSRIKYRLRDLATWMQVRELS